MDTKENSINNNHHHLLSAKGQRTMLISIAVCVIICAVLFSLLGVYMVNHSKDAIDKIGQQTMQETSKQFSQRFQAVMKQRLQMVESLKKEYEDNKGSGMSEEDCIARLIQSAKYRGFTYLAFLRVNESAIEDVDSGRTIEFLLGSFIVDDPVPFRQSVLNKESKIAVGEGKKDANSQSEDIVMYSVPMDSHTIKDTNLQSMSLIVGVTNKAFVDMLNTEAENKGTATNYIVRNDKVTDENGNITGETNTFVLQPKDSLQYDSLSALLRESYGKSDSSIKNTIAELNEKMAEEKDYSRILHVGSDHKYMYCTKLENSEWYLVSFADNYEMNLVVEDLNNQWIVMIVVAVITIIVMLMVIFVIYNHFNKQTLLQLEHASEAALSASKAKSEFLSNMSHDIRTPMNAIVGMTAIARSHIDDPEHVSNCLKKITLSSKHLLGLINDVLDMSKIESGKMTLNMEQISLREVLDGITTIVQPQIKTKRQNFNVIIRNVEQENVYCDSVRLNQVLLNLLSNAIKFTAEEGTIEIYLDQEQSPLGDDYVRTHIRVKDNGIGMSDEFQKKIFDSFTREDSKRVHHTEGSGLGMAITKYIVDAMKGTIELKSELGMGTQFHITLDLEKALVNEEDMVLPNWNMLLVDDDQQLCETTTGALKEIGIDADWTLDGEDAVNRTVKAHNARKGYDVILIDWKLPGIDGIETAKRIRKQLGDDNVPILLISAYDWSEIETEARAAGINGFISKPLFKSTLFYGLKAFAGNDAVQTEAEQTSSKADLAGLHVLLAEDNELNWEIAETLLDSVGIKCDHAENGQICVDMFKNSQAGTYQAILMDIRMPVMSGYEATEEIRKLDHPDKDLPIIAMTADAFADDMKKCLDCGMNAHIAKPIDIDVVQSTLAKFIKK